MKKSAIAHHVNRRPQIRLALSRPEVAIAIGVSTSSVNKMVSEGALPPPRIWHTRKFWLVAELEAYLNTWPTDEQVDSENRIDRAIDLSGRSCEPPSNASTSATLADPDQYLEQYYDRLGFDPATMGEAEFQKLQLEATERWRASIPSTPLNKRERNALAQLVGYGVGVPVHWRKIKHCGLDTQERLVARNYIETRNHVRYPDRIDSYILTEDGLKAWQVL